MSSTAEKLNRVSGAALLNSSGSLENTAFSVLNGAEEAKQSLAKQLAAVDGIDTERRWIRPKMERKISEHQKKCGHGGKCKIGSGLARYVGLGDRRINTALLLPHFENGIDVPSKNVEDNLVAVRRLLTTTTTTTPSTTTTASTAHTTSPSGLLPLSDADIIEAVVHQRNAPLRGFKGSPYLTHRKKGIFMDQEYDHPRSTLFQSSLDHRRKHVIEEAARKAAAEAARLFDLQQTQ